MLYLQTNMPLQVLEKTDYLYAKNPSNHWSCINCNEVLFPFNQIDDNDFFKNLASESIIRIPISLERLSDKLFSPFELGELDQPLSEFDPDLNFFSTCINNLL